MRTAALLAALCVAAAAPARAAVTLNSSWMQERQREVDLPASGYGAGLSVDLGTHFSVGASYSVVRTESFEDAIDGVEGRLEYRSGGVDLGAVWPWTQSLGATLTGGYARASTRGLDGFENDRHSRDDGPTGSLTLWWQPLTDVAFNAGRGYSYIGAVPGWDTSAGLGLRLWRELWLDGAWWRGDGIDGWTAGLRVTFAGD